MLERELARFSEFKTVSERLRFDKASKETMSRIFWAEMKGSIRRHEYMNLFFESGSTLVYVSDSFEKNMLRFGIPIDDDDWHVWTNNVLTLFQLLLYTDVDVERFPACAPNPKDRYGAIFPREWYSIEENYPSEPRDLYPKEVRAVEKMKEDLNKFGEKTLILATSSGWDLDNKLDDFKGPHVGSHANMLFKRALFTSGLPTVIFLAAEKLGEPFHKGNCFSVFGPDERLHDAIEDYPLALCVGYDKATRSATGRKLPKPERKQLNDPAQILEKLAYLGFNETYTNNANLNSKNMGAIIAGNQAFHKLIH
jgi:hypothetical protein